MYDVTQVLAQSFNDYTAQEKNLSVLDQRINDLLPVVQVKYVPVTEKHWYDLIKAANCRARNQYAGLKKPVPDAAIKLVVEKLKAENPQGFPYYLNSKGQWEKAVLESDLFGCDYSESWLAPKQLNAALMQANTDLMTKSAGKYMARVGCFSRSLYLGHYHSKAIAETTYKAAKQMVLNKTAQHYGDFLPERVRVALSSYVV